MVIMINGYDLCYSEYKKILDKLLEADGGYMGV